MENVFRIKKSRDGVQRSKQNEIISGTLDSVHQNIVQTIKENQLNIEDMKSKKEEIEEEINDLEMSSILEHILKVSRMKEEIKEIDEKLNIKDPLSYYYTKNADIMLKYYGNIDKSQVSSTNPTDQNTFMKYLTASSTGSIETPIHSKKQMFEEYATRMKLNTGNETVVERSVEHCDQCNVSREEQTSEGILVCPLCGSEEYMLVVSDFPSFRDPPKERNNYAYKKINHLNEILNQFQAKESTIIPEEVMNEVICEVKKRRIQNIAELTEKDMREILKKLNRSKYYEHATHILSQLNGNPPPTITPEIEEKIRSMFQEIQAPFLIYCPDDRTNFLSYSYILYKFFELIDLDEYKVYFPLLKSRDRLITHDQLWKKICEYLKWEFIPSL